MQDSTRAWGSRGRVRAKPKKIRTKGSSRSYLGRLMGAPSAPGAGAGQGEAPLAQARWLCRCPCPASRPQPRECSQTLGANTEGWSSPPSHPFLKTFSLATQTCSNAHLTSWLRGTDALLLEIATFCWTPKKPSKYRFFFFPQWQKNIQCI